MTTVTSYPLPAHRRQDLSDQTWLLLEPLLPGCRGVWGGVAKENRLFLNAVFWILRSGASWRDLPRIMATGKTRTDAFAGGAIRVCGHSCWKRWSPSQTLNG